MGKVWITSDLHFCHDKDFCYKPRGFNSVNEMNKAIVENWNSIVSKDDKVYLLGDVMLNDNIMGFKLLESLNGDITIVSGNHDTLTRLSIYEDAYSVVKVAGPAMFLKYKGYSLYLSHYPTKVGNYDNDKPLKARMINFCGHTHTPDRFCDMNENMGLVYHVELDAHDNKPILLDDAIDDIKNYLAN